MSGDFGGEGPAYHYSRAERLKRGGHDTGRSRKGNVFKRNRSLLVVVIDLLLIVVAYVLLQVLVIPDQTTREVYGYRFRLRAVEFENEVLYTLNVSPQEPEDGLPGTLLVAVFRAGERSARAADVLPSADVAERALRGRSRLADGVEEAQATVTVGEESFTLEAEIQRE